MTGHYIIVNKTLRMVITNPTNFSRLQVLQIRKIHFHQLVLAEAVWMDIQGMGTLRALPLITVDRVKDQLKQVLLHRIQV